MKIVVTGATGLLGKALVEQLTINGDSITVLTRNALKAKQVLPSNIDVFQWDPLSGPPPQESLEGSDAVVHLIGEPIQGRWTKRKKERIFRSRVTSTRNLVAAIKAMDAPPFKIVSASAVGYYGDRGDEKLTEFAGHGEGFLADVSVEWENSLSSLSDAGISITPLRLGLVLSNQGGVLKQLSFPWRLGLGVKIGAGLQWWPWIHIEDAIGLIHHALNGLMPHGPINAIAPEPVTQAEFAKELARVLHRPQIFRIPQFFLRILLGEMSWELTASRLAVSRETGYTFRFNTLNVALNDLLPNGVLNQNGMKRYQTEMWVDAPIDKVFEFFSDPANLEQITPPWLNFKMMTHQPPSIGVGTIIDYRLRLRRIPISWQSEITEWNPPYRFVDVQNKGPYRHWAHTHEFETKNGGTFVKDTVDYKVPGGCIVDKLLVRRDLAHIFEYRQCQLRKIFL